MDQEKLEEYKGNLEKERLLLSAEIKRDEQPVDFGNDTEDPSEETDKSEATGDQIAMANDLKSRLVEVDIALGKIREGKYGVCEKCGGEIEGKILEIDPESHFCKKCKMMDR